MLCRLVALLVAWVCWPSAFGQEKFDLYIESGIHHSARSVAFSPDGRFIAAGSLDRTIKVWQRRDGREVLTLPSGSLTVSLLYAPDGNRLLASGEDGAVQVWDLAAVRQIATLRCASTGAPIALAEEGTLLLCADEASGQLHRWELATLTQAPSLALPPGAQFGALRLAADGVLLAGSDDTARVALLDTTSLAPFGTLPAKLDSPSVAISVARRSGRVAVSDGASITVWRLGADAAQAPSVERHFAIQTAHAVRFSPQEDVLAVATESGDIVLFDSGAWTEQGRIASRSNRIEHAGMLPDSHLLALQVWYDSKFTFNLKTGALEPFAAPDLADPFQWSAAGAVGVQDFVIETRQNAIRLLRRDGAEICTIIVLDKQKGWVVVAPDGRFDTNMDLADVQGVHWYARENWTDPLPLDIFMRDYFEPRLLPRLLAQGAAAFKPMRPQALLERRQPLVRIASVEQGPGTEIAHVSVEVTENGGSVHDVRLFRNGQLVGQFPKPSGPMPPGYEQLDAWRAMTRVAPADGKGRASLSFAVPLAHRFAGQPVVFSAYAFNRDRVKSDTARHAGFIAARLASPHRPRAYVIAMGVDRYEDPGLKLEFAARDARVLGAALAQVKGYEVVPITLLSTGHGKGRLDQASKAGLRTIIAQLAGKAAPGALARLQARGVDRRALRQLRKATPDDLVVVAFSGHGYTRPGGQFYLLPSDSGQWADPAAIRLDKAISGAELTQWLADVDAGQFALIIDACHSGASVDDGHFKPGPMGDSSLGQLAYDKGMLVLAATQPSDVALEAGALRQGLLSYALARDALSRRADRPGRVQGDLDGDGRLTLVEWLTYGERRVPALYQDMRAGRIRAHRRGIGTRDPTAEDQSWFDSLAERAQTPAFFNFLRSSTEIELVVPPRPGR